MLIFEKSRIIKNPSYLFLKVFVKIFNEEGSRSFYRGFIPTIIGVIPYAGISFFTYDTLKKIYFGNSIFKTRPRFTIKKYVSQNLKKYVTKLFTLDKHGTTHLSGVTALFFGAIAGILGQTSSYPLDIVRRRMQTTRVDHMVMEYMTIFGTIKKIYRYEKLHFETDFIHKLTFCNFIQGWGNKTGFFQGLIDELD